MAIEIERKFLVTGEYKHLSHKSLQIKQGYISPADRGRNVRIRIQEDKGYITIKGPSIDGVSRYEWEKEIPLQEAQELINICNVGIIEKTRYLINVGQHTFEVDEFHGKNRGLVIAEIELSRPDETFLKPSWLGEEVTGNSRYYNSALSIFPFKEWKNH